MEEVVAMSDPLENLERSIRNELKRLVELVPGLTSLTPPDAPERARLLEIKEILQRALDELGGGS
jgi:hypothetical protein